MLIYGVLPLTLLLLKKKERYAELFIGFLFILILSDSRQHFLRFAAQIKDIYLIILAIFFFLEINKFKPLNKIFTVFVPFFSLVFLLVFISPNPWLTFQKTFSYCLLYLIVPNYIVMLYRQNGIKILKDLLYFISIIIIVGLILKVFSSSIVSFGERYNGIFGNPNGLGIFCILSFLFLILISGIEKDILSRQEKLLIYSVIFFSIYLCGSRTAIFSVLLFLILARFYKMSPLLGFSIFISGILVYLIIETNLVGILNSLGMEEFLRTETLEAGAGRFVAWNFAWEKIQKNFFFGRGFAYDEYIFTLYKETLSFLGHQGGTHNSFLSFWMNSGITGLILYFSAFLILFLSAAKKNPLVFPILFSVLFSITFESWLIASLNPFTIFFLIILTVLTADEFNTSPHQNTVSLL